MLLLHVRCNSALADHPLSVSELPSVRNTKAYLAMFFLLLGSNLTQSKVRKEELNVRRMPMKKHVSTTNTTLTLEALCLFAFGLSSIPMARA